MRILGSGYKGICGKGYRDQLQQLFSSLAHGTNQTRILLLYMRWGRDNKSLLLLIKNLRNTVHSSLCGFFDAHSQRKTYEVPTRYRADTGKDSVKSAQKFLIFNNCSGVTHPVSSSIVHSSYRYCEDFARDLPAICRPREGFFSQF